MEWREEAVVLGVRRHGETSVVAELMTRERGRHLGLVRGGRSRRLQPVLQPGNRVLATWRARLDEHLGFLVIEPVASRAGALMENPVGLHGVQLLAAHLRLLPERDPHPRLFDALEEVIAGLNDGPRAGALILRFEVMVLEELGFGLDLERCAATGAKDDLVYVSPKTGRAVSREAGAPWKDRLLPLPAFLAAGRETPDAPALAEGFRLTGHFLARHVWQARGIEEPLPRGATLAAIHRALARESLAGALQPSD